METHKGHLARVGYGSRQMTETPEGKEVAVHSRCRKMCDWLAESAGDIDHTKLQHWFQEPDCAICGENTIDMMVFNNSTLEAYLSRGPRFGVQWQKFTFQETV